MPNDVKKSKGKKVAATTVQTNDDFDDMLAELCTADLSSLPAVRSAARAAARAAAAAAAP
jgi:hypothetical protein